MYYLYVRRLRLAWRISGGAPPAGKSLRSRRRSRAIALDASYDRITVGSWIAVDRPTLYLDRFERCRPHHHCACRYRRSHQRNGHGYGFQCKGFDSHARSAVAFRRFRRRFVDFGLTRSAFSRYARLRTSRTSNAGDDRSTPTSKAAAIDFDGVYSGLEPGRWIIVSGNRTDVPGSRRRSGLRTGNDGRYFAAGLAGVRNLRSARPSHLPRHLSCNTSIRPAPTPTATGWLSGSSILRYRPRLRICHFQRIANQQFCNQVELGRRTVCQRLRTELAEEREVSFPSFEGMLVDPATGVPFAERLHRPYEKRTADFLPFGLRMRNCIRCSLWRNGLAYSYDRGSVTIYGNVTDATHGQSPAKFSVTATPRARLRL